MPYNIIGGGGGTIDNTTDTHIPVKLAGSFENSPLSWSGVPGENIISSETIEVPPGTIQIGEGMKMSAAGVIPIFNSLLTGKKYIPNLFEYDTTGSDTTFTLDLAAETRVIVQADFSASTPLTGTFSATTTTSQFINSFEIKTNASAVLAGVRLQLIAQSTGEPIYYFPSKAAWQNDTGEDLTADASGNINIDFGEAPLGLLVGEAITTNYKIDSGVLLGTGTIPYHAIDQQIAIFTNMATEPWVVDYVAQHGGGTTTFTEISADVDLDGPRNYIVDTLTPAAAVTINIPYEELSSFTVRDETKEFDTYNCIITIRDALDVIVHTATLNKRDKEWIFYNSDGTEDGWRYGEIGKGLIVDIASDHVASTDFGDVYTDTPTWDCRRFNSGACYDDPNLMMMGDPGSFTSKQYVDGLISNPPRLDAYLSTNLSVTLETETIIAFDTVEKALGITLSAGEATFTEGGRYTGHIVLRANEDRDPVTYIWLERKPAATGVWELFNNMLSMIIKEDVTLPLPGDMEVIAGDKVRVKIYFTKSDATLDLESASLVVGLGTIVQPSASISIVKVGEVTP